MSLHVSFDGFSRSMRNDISLINDPITLGYLDVGSFIDVYRPLLELLDGKDYESYMDFYFTRSPCNKSLLEFIDQSQREDFLYQATEMGLIPSMKEITWGQREGEIAHSASVPDLVQHLNLEMYRSSSVPLKKQEKRPLKDKNSKKLLCAQIHLSVILINKENL